MKPTYEELERQLEESRREFRAADATIHNLELKLTDMAVQLADAESKCREMAGVVADNADLKSLIEQHADSIAVCPNCSHEEPSETDDIVALYRSMETPFTDAFLAEVRASAIRDALDESSDYLYTDCVMDRLDISYEDAELRTSGAIEMHDALFAVANQLRKGASE